MTYAPHVPHVVYEVVPDRFRVGGGRTPAEKLRDPVYTRSGMLTHPERTEDLRVHHGGDLRGLLEALPHLKSLHVDGLCLSHIFRATRGDKDAAEDFLEVDPTLGTDADFDELIARTHELGIKVILEGAFNYVGVRHPWFETARQHPDESQLDPSERTRDFFYFDPQDNHAGYQGDSENPELNLHNHELRRRLFTGERSAVHHWLARGAAGWCLRRADELGYTVVREVALSARTGGAHRFVIGDVRGWADRLVKDGLLDGAFNRYLREALMAWLQGQIPAAYLARILSDQVHRYGRDALNRSWNWISTLDTKRAAAMLKGDMARVRLAVSVMYALPGAASIFYGEETGLGGRSPAHSLLAFDWDESAWDQDLLAHHRLLGQVKHSTPSLQKGDVVDLTPPGEEDVLAFARTRRDPRETVVAVFNRAYRSQQRLLFLPVPELPDGLPLRDLMGGEPARVRCGALNIEVPPTGAKILVPDLTGPLAASHHYFRNF
jgi:glycosidase